MIYDPGMATDGGPPTRTDWAERLLRDEILTGRLRPGEHLKINVLVDRYDGLSPTPVREALSRLAGSGFVEVLPRRGMRVAAASRAELRDLVENRLRLEAAALERAVSRGDAAWDALVEATHHDLGVVSEAATRTDESAAARLMAWEEAHRRFHFALLARCDSPWLLRLIGIVYDNTMRYRWLTLGHDGVRSVASAFERHRPLLDAAHSRDVEGAVAELRRHTRLTLDSIDELELP
jgi:GntR family transcriptional regulator, carbon starvation induced regulator